MTTPEDMIASPDAIDVVKRPLTVTVTFADADGSCDTLEGPVCYAAGDAILTGVKGERWPVARARFLASYVPTGDTRGGEDGSYRKLPKATRAVRLQRDVQVAVGGAASMVWGHRGDWLLRYAYGDYGVVTDEIFALTYARLSGAQG